MIALAFEIFGMVSIATGCCLLALSLYIKHSYKIVFDGFSSASGRAGGTLRFWMLVVLGVLFIGTGAAMLISVRIGLV